MPARKKFQEIAEHLELQIYSGKLKVGDKIPSERELMSQFAAGRSSVREGLFALQRKGLLIARAGAAARVSMPSADRLIADVDGVARLMLQGPDGMRRFQHARALFEIGLARDAALYADDVGVGNLEAALAKNGAAVNQATFETTDMSFHCALALMTCNPVFAALHEALAGWLTKQRTVSARAGATRAEMYSQDEAIFEAIARRDSAAAQTAMEIHLATVTRYYWQAMSHGALRADQTATV